MEDILKIVLGYIHKKTPLVISISGSVGVGKSFFAEELKCEIEKQAEQGLKVVVVSTDGFLFPNKQLGKVKKGFPQSYNLVGMNCFLQNFKTGKPARSPVYSHTVYDIIPNEYIDATCADILIFEGLCGLHKDVREQVDFSIFLDAEEQVLLQWYMDRALKNREKAKADPKSYFAQFLGLTEEEYRAAVTEIWNTINRPNLYENILPEKQHADIVIRKDAQHCISVVKR